MKRLLNVDLFAGLGAIGFAVTSLYATELQQLVAPEVSFGFGATALVRWVATLRASK